MTAKTAAGTIATRASDPCGGMRPAAAPPTTNGTRRTTFPGERGGCQSGAE